VTSHVEYVPIIPSIASRMKSTLSIYHVELLNLGLEPLNVAAALSSDIYFESLFKDTNISVSVHYFSM